MATRRIPQGPQRVPHHGEQDMNPLRGFGLAHPEQAPMEHLRGILLQIDQDEQQSIFRGRQRTVRVGRIASRLSAPPMQGPFGHGAQEGRLTGGDQRRKLICGQAGQISQCRRVGWNSAIS